MAKLSAHGKEIGRIDGLTRTKAYFENGDILVNYTGDWHVYGKVKSGYNPTDVFAKRLKAHKDFIAARPALAAYRKALIEAGHSRRSLIHVAIQSMPDDPDGVWAECNDMLGMNLTVDEAADLCRLYRLAQIEVGTF